MTTPEATPRPWQPPTVIGDRCLRCGANLNPHRDFDNHGPCQREAHGSEAVADRLRKIEAAARVVCDPMVEGAGGDRWWDAHAALRAALDEESQP